LNATDEMGATGDTAPLGDLMLSMDVADTLRRTPEIAEDPDAMGRLKAIYASLGLTPSAGALSDGLEGYRTKRFVYVPKQAGLGVSLARLYVVRRHWLPGAVAIGLMLLIGLGGYYLIYRPYHDRQIEQARVELAETIPAQIDGLYETIFDETKVQQAANDAAGLRDRGKAAAAKGDRDAAEAAIADLTNLRDTVRQDYRMQVVDRPGSKWGFWTFPEDNSEATNYYIVVEAHDTNGVTLNLPVLNEQTGKTETVSIWGLRVPEEVYRAVEADKADDGTIEHNLVGVKQFGFIDVDYLVDVLGGAVTHW